MPFLRTVKSTAVDILCSSWAGNVFDCCCSWCFV